MRAHIGGLAEHTRPAQGGIDAGETGRRDGGVHGMEHLAVEEKAGLLVERLACLLLDEPAEGIPPWGALVVGEITADAKFDGFEVDVTGGQIARLGSLEKGNA